MTAAALGRRALDRALAADRVWLAVAALLLALALFAQRQARVSLLFTLESLLFVSPFLLLSTLLAAAIAATGLDRRLGDILSGRPAAAVALAALFGALSPFCSVSVIPAIAALLAARVPLAPVMAFWAGSPHMDPEMFILTGALIDWPFATLRLLAAIGLGLAAGYLTQTVAARPPFARPFAEPLRRDIAAQALGSVWSSCPAEAVGPAGAAPDWRFWRRAGARRAFARQSLAIGLFLGKWLTLAFLLESLLVALLPPDGVAEGLAGGALWAVPAATAIGIPTYLNGYAAIPMIGRLIEMGVPPSAALAFMIAGEATSIPTAMSVLVLVKRPVFAWYLALSIAGAVAAGYSVQGWLWLAG